METTRSLHIEDNSLMRLVVEQGLDNISHGQHQVVAAAATLPEAQAVLDEVAEGGIDIDVILLDNSLSNSSENEAIAEDALVIRQYIEILDLPVRVVGLGTTAMERSGVRLDANLPKHLFSINQLVARLDALEAPAVTTR